MDSTTKVVLYTSTVPNNQTDVSLLKDEVEYLSIIVWGMGGAVLISLLFFLGRIILAPRKQLQDIDYISDECRASPSLYQIGVDNADWPYPPPSSRQIQRPDSSNWQTSPRAPQYTPRTDGQSPRHSTSPTTSQTTSINSQTREYVTAAEADQSQTGPEACILPTDPTGTRAAVNGYIIRPPSYRDVIGIGTQLPSNIISRPQPRYQLFSL